MNMNAASLGLILAAVGAALMLFSFTMKTDRMPKSGWSPANWFVPLSTQREWQTPLGWKLRWIGYAMLGLGLVGYLVSRM